MNFSEARELVRLRHELRRLLAAGRRREARPLLARLRELAERDEIELDALGPELKRWEVSLDV